MTITKRKAMAFALAAGILPLGFAGSSNAQAITFSAYYKLPGGNGTEPGIDHTLDSNGKQVTYVHGTFGIPSHNKLWRMDDSLVRNAASGFKSITFTTPYNRLPGGGDADVAARGDDVWFIDLWAGSNSIQYSPDKGETWTRGTPLSSIPTSDRQWISLGDSTINPVTNETETTVYLTDQGLLTPRRTTFARSRNNGLVWDYYRPVSDSPASLGMGGIPAHIVSAGKRVAIASNSGGRFNVAVSNDEGENWKVTSVSGSLSDANGSLVGLTMNAENPDDLAIVYPTDGNINGVTNRNAITVRVSRDGGDTWSDITQLSPAGKIGWFPWVDWRGDKIAVAWYQATNGGFTDPNNPTPGNQWNVYYSESIDNGANWTTGMDIGAGPVKNGAICTNGLACDADRDLGDFLQLAVDYAGKSWITFVNAGGLNQALFGNGIYVKVQD
ncbi:MAG: exo-alpha-sialidase [Actinomycetota bacterium]